MKFTSLQSGIGKGESLHSQSIFFHPQELERSTGEVGLPTGTQREPFLVTMSHAWDATQNVKGMEIKPKGDFGKF